jgi:hypothetical protein
MTNLLRQSVYTRLAGYEDVNDAQRVRYMESKKVLHTMVISNVIAIILCFVLTSMATVRERCFVQAMSTALIVIFLEKSNEYQRKWLHTES